MQIDILKMLAIQFELLV